MVESVFIAIGSNLGDRVLNIESALEAMHASRIHVTSTGFLYESAAMYKEDQPAFLNTCIEVVTELSPDDLLTELKSIETKLGREPTERNGPRIIDLDILLYGDRIINQQNLTIPHPRMTERPFVLLPLLDIKRALVHPVHEKLIKEFLPSSIESCRRVTPSGLPSQLIHHDSRSIIVGILNVTPDSFSDGGRYLDVNAAVAHAKELVTQGADIIDIGGESTRPTADKVEEQEEIRRVADVVKKVRRALPGTPISIDTYKSATARAAVAAGACIVNDVSGGMLDPEMLRTVAELRTPFICTHAGQIGKHSFIDYGDGKPSCLTSDMSVETVIETVRLQLSGRLRACMEAGIPRWNVVLDPGLGFGKSGRVNFTILKNLDQIFSGPLEGIPVMIGASRKRFIRDFATDGSIWSNTEHEAMVGTAAVTAAAISTNTRAQFHRVHDVAEMRRVVDICDRIFRE